MPWDSGVRHLPLASSGARRARLHRLSNPLTSMKSLLAKCLRWSLALGLWSGLGPVAAVAAEFEPARWTGEADRAARVHVPDGTRRVRLLTRESASGAWTVHGMMHLDGRAGTLKVRLPDGVAWENLALEASDTDPFPHSAYQGRNRFEATSSGAMGGVRDGMLAPGAVVNADAETADGPATTAAVQESDIWKWRDRTLYYFNTLRGLQVFDLSVAAQPKRVASLRLPAVGEDMYLAGTDHVVLLANRQARAWESGAASGPQSEIVVVRHDGASLEETARLPVDGAFMESRMVGATLCVVTQKTVESPAPGGGMNYSARLLVYAVDLNDPSRPVVRGPLDVTPSDNAWIWQPVVQATSDYLFLSSSSWTGGGAMNTWLSVIDLRDRTQPLSVGTRLPIAGQIRTRFQIACSDGTLTTVSERAGAVIETWNLAQALAGMGPALPKPIDSLLVGANEGLFATRFDGPRVHVVTFRRIDPLFCVDISDPADLRLLGELEVPGFSTYLESFADGTRLLSLGVEEGRVAASVFDVGDPSRPTLKSRVSFGDGQHGSWSEGNYDDKAIGFFRDAGLMVFPLQHWSEQDGYRTGMQLIDATADGLRARGFVDHRFNARRARVFDQTLVSIGSQELFVLDVTDRDNPVAVGSLAIAWPVRAVVPHGDRLAQLEDGDFSHTASNAGVRPPRLRLTSKTEPDLPLAELAIAPAGLVAGTAVQGDLLYVLLRSQKESVAPGADGQPMASWKSVLTTVVIDLAAAGGPVVAGTAASERDGYGWGYDRLESQWLPDGRLVWYPSQVNNYRWWWWGPMIAVDLAVGAAADVAFAAPWRWGGGEPDDILIVDVAAANQPRVVAREPAIVSANSIGSGRVLAAGPGRLIVTWTEWSSTESVWKEAALVQELDVSDPASVRRGPAASVPAIVTGAHRTAGGGTVLFASRQESTTNADGSVTWSGASLVDALAFDGVQAFLLDTARVEKAGWSATAVSGPHFLTLLPSPDGVAGSTAKVLGWDEPTGKWRPLDDVSLASRWPSLTVRGGYFFASEGNLVEIVAAHQWPATPAHVRQALDAPAWDFSGVSFDDADKEAWLPVDVYGVERLDLSTLPSPAGGPRISPRDKTSPEWQRLALLPAEIGPAAATLGGLPPLEATVDYAFAADADAERYEAWAIRHFPNPELPAAGVLGDPDGDGFDNYSEWAFGTSPSEAYSIPQVFTSLQPGEAGAPARLVVTAYLNPLAEVEPVPIGSYLALVPEFSDGGSDWQLIPEETLQVSHSPTRRLWSIPLTEASAATFVRLRLFFVMEG